MSILLIKRANRAVMLSVAAILVASLLAPIIATANTDLAPGDSAVVSNAGGANLRSETTTEDASIISELPAGTTVWVNDGPYYTDTGVWVFVATDGYGPGYVSANLLQRIGNEELATANGVSNGEVDSEESAPVTSDYAWLEPVDSLVVVDLNVQLTEKGLPVLADANLDAPVLGYIHVGSGLDVTSERIWEGDLNFVRVNYNGAGAFVDGRYVELASEWAPAEPEAEEVIWIDDPVVTTPEEAAPVADTSEELVTEEVAPEEVVTEEVAPEEVVTEEAAPEEVVTEEAASEEVVTEEAAPEEVVTEEVAPEEAVTEEAAPEEVVTEEALVVESAPIASTANLFDPNAMIGSATVTGTSSGLLCRADANPSAPVLMTLAEGTKVLVSAEPVNGYLGIDCGGLQGFADVNYLWSGGAGDAEITGSQMNVVVTGTGNGLNCRTGAGLNHSVISTVFDGTTMVTRGAASNGWTPVTCAGQNGFVSTTWIEVTSGSGNAGNNSGSTVASGTAVVNTGGDGLYCRSGAGTSYGVITVLRHGTSVTVRGAQQGEWVPVTCGGSAGFAHGSYLNVSPSSGTPAPPSSGPSTPTGSVTVANTGGQGLNCRTGAGTSHSIITTLALGQSVQSRSGSTNGWTAVICGGTNGFISSEFVSGGSAGTTPSEPTPPPSTPSGMTSGDHGKVTSNLNLRYSASLSSSISTTVASGNVVLITGALSNDFYPVDYDGLTGFMHKDYLVKTSEALSKRGGSGTPSNPAPTTPPTNPGTSSPTGNAMVNYAMRYLGYPYVWATRGPASFDCSGFTYWVTLNVTGKNIGGGTWTQVSAGTPVSRANLQAGDLVFFQNTYTAGLSHVGLYIGNGQFIHAQNEATGVVISDLDSSYYGPRWYGAVRL